MSFPHRFTRLFRTGPLLLLFQGAIFFLIYALWPGPQSAPVTIIIENGSHGAKIAEQLAQGGVVRETISLRLLARVTENGLKAGEYVFPARASLAEVFSRLWRGEVVAHAITIPEGLSSQQIVRLLEAEPLLTGTLDSPPAEGSLLPETYFFQRNEPRAALVARMQAAMSKTLAELWPQRAANLPLPDSAAAVTLASVVERETGQADERAKVAGVFINRLRLGMRLQSDPTVIYALSKGLGVLERPLLRKDWEYAHPYNTYQNAGLPPGPIANPGRASLLATLNPETHEYVYFVADGTGGHAFAKTLAEHNANVAKWQAWQRAQNR